MITDDARNACLKHSVLLMQVSDTKYTSYHKASLVLHLQPLMLGMTCPLTKQVSGHEFTHAVSCDEDSISLRRRLERSVAERQQKASATEA